MIGKGFLISSAIGWGVRKFAPVISKKIKEFFEEYQPEKILSNIDNEIEKKVGLDLFSEDTQKKLDSFIHYAVEFVESSMTDQAKIRFVLNLILRGKTSFKKEDLKKYAGQSWQEFLKNIPSDIKELLSKNKLEFATEIFEHYWSLLGEQKVEKYNISASIKRAVDTKNDNQKIIEKEHDEDSFSETWKRLTEESQKRQGKK